MNVKRKGKPGALDVFFGSAVVMRVLHVVTSQPNLGGNNDVCRVAIPPRIENNAPQARFRRFRKNKRCRGAEIALQRQRQRHSVVSQTESTEPRQRYTRASSVSSPAPM